MKPHPIIVEEFIKCFRARAIYNPQLKQWYSSIKKKNCSLLRTDTVRGQIPEHISAPNGGYFLYNFIQLYNPSYSRILIGSCLWSIRRPDARLASSLERVSLCVLKWQKGRRKIKPFLLKNDPEKNTRAVSVGSRTRLNQTQSWSW